MKFGLGHSHELPIRHSLEKRVGLFLEHESIINQGYEQAVKLLENEAVNHDTYIGVYSSEEIEEEKHRTEEVEKKMQHDDPLQEKVAFVAEAFLYEQIGRYSWLSTKDINVFPEKTSRIDDVLRHTDLVLTFETEAGEEPLAITVDVTIGVRYVQKKILSIKSEIDNRGLTTVKFHETPSGKKGPLERTPRVVLSLEPEVFVKELLPLWLKKTPESRERLKTHPVQLDLMREVKVQLEAYEEYARDTGKTEVAERFKKALGIVSKICSEKEKAATVTGEREEMRSLRDLRTALKSQLRNPSSQKVLKETSLEERQRAEILKRLQT